MNDESSVAAQSGKKAFIKTYGCQMNVYDSERMGDVLAARGYVETSEPELADLVILNTCHIREKAAEKVYSEIGRLRAVKQKRAACGKGMLIAVSGCVAQAEGEEIMNRAPVVDMVFGPQVYHRLPTLLDRVERGERVVEIDFPTEDKFKILPAASPAAIRSRGRIAFLTIQEGCDKFCSFCVVPYTRGAEVSRPANDIVDEARRFAASGVMEIVLLGQNVNAYLGTDSRGRTVDLAALLHLVADVPGIERLRYTTSHPRDMNDSLIDAHAHLPQLMPYLHLPVQSGSDRILTAMNRRHTAHYYLDMIARVRAARPDIALSSDFIVGFPGESDSDFEETLSLVREVGFAQAYSFKYSPRPGTPGADLSPCVDEAVKVDRLSRLQAELTAQQHAFNDACVGQVMPVLMDRSGRRDGQLGGRSPYSQTVYVNASRAFLGGVHPVRITGCRPSGLLGEMAHVV